MRSKPSGRFGNNFMSRQFGNIYKGKKVLVTGHTGFKGSWLTLWLTELGATVVGYSIDKPSKPNHFDLLKLGITSVKGDILDKDKLLKTIKKHEPDIIFHLAAQALVRKSYRIPRETFETNIMGTINVLEAIRMINPKIAVINVTSDKCYSNKEQERGYTENDPMGGDDPYSASKGAVELVSHSYRKSFSLTSANVRAGNVIGGGDWAEDRLIPDIMKATARGKSVHIRNPHSTRPWQHVLEPLSGYLAVGAELLKGSDTALHNWNFGPTDSSSLSVFEVTEHTKKHWPDITYLIEKDVPKVHEAKLLSLDSTKARQELGWKSVWNADTTFAKTVGWYKEFYTHKKVVSKKDLESYIRDAKKIGVRWAKD